MAGPFLPNLEPIIQAGIDPKTGLPLKAACGNIHLKENVTSLFTVVDRQDAITRFKWNNLPLGLTSELIERVLYYKGQGILFKMSDEKYYFLPYTLCGNIDMYGRWMQVTPVPFAGGDTDASKPWIKGLIKVPVYDLDIEEVDVDSSCVIIRDYSAGLSEYVVPRAVLNRPLVELESELIPFLRTSLLNSTGVQGIRVADEECSQNVLAASKAIDEAALTGNKYIPIVGNLEFQDLTTSSPSRADDFLMSMQSLDNLRLQMLGITNGGLFQKKEHVLQSESDMNTMSQTITLKDAYAQRKNACEIINNVFGLDISVEVIENNEEELTLDIVEESEDEDVLSAD